MNQTQNLSDTPSLTGQAKIQSLNSIYNRVTLLKSKNVSRKLIKANNEQSYSFLSNNFESPFNTNQQTFQTENFQSNFNSKRYLNKLPYNNDRQSDNIETNFWPSENLLQQNRMLKMIQRQQINQKAQIPSSSNGKRRFLSTAVNKISKTISVRENNETVNYGKNRRYLMSDYMKRQPIKSTEQKSEQSKINRTTLNVNTKNDRILSNNKMIAKPLFSLSSSVNNSRRPFTSSLSRQRQSSFNYRISEASKSKQTLFGKAFASNNSKTTGINNKNSQNTSSKKSLIKQSTKNLKDTKTLSKKSLTSSKVSLIKGQTRYQTYKQQIRKFQQLYQCLSEVLASIKQGLQQVQRAVSKYSKLFQSNKLSFIDDFIEDRQQKLQKLVRTTRIQQTLSICYLFLQIAQQRIYDNESYLVNFIGHSLSNLLLVLRLYMLKQRKEEFQWSQFQLALKQMQKVSYGQELTSQNDILLRIQHNTQILTMIHKKLGRNNQKFESCIVKFFKFAQREKHSCSLSAHYIFQFLAMHIHELQLVGISPTLQLAPKPYAPPAKKDYTLVIQPIGILQKDGSYRPYLNQFMKWACKNFDIILWTWEQTLQVQALFDQLSQFATTKLYRHHCKIHENIFIKDLSRLQRDLTKTLIIDFDRRIFSGYQNNGIQCRWRGNKSDKSLLVLSQILQEMITSETSVQDTLVFYAQELFRVRGY